MRALIDTALGRFRSCVERVEDPEFRAFAHACKTAPVVTGPMEEDGNVIPSSWTGCIEPVGPVKLCGDGSVYFGRSLASFHQEVLTGKPAKEVDNGKVLTAGQASMAWQVMAESLAERLPFVVAESLEGRRFDPVYDRRVGDTMVVLRSLEGAVKPTRKGCSWFRNEKGVDTGLMMHGGLVVHRVYDKGLQLRDERFKGVLRSEEQLRAGSVGLMKIYDQAKREFAREECRAVINERYLEVAYGEQISVGDLVKEGRDTMALLVLHPELMPMYRERVKRSGYYKMKKQVRELRAKAIPVDLRVPEDAWTAEGG